MTIPVTMTHTNTWRRTKYFHTAHVCNTQHLGEPVPLEGSIQELLCPTASYNNGENDK